VTSADRHHDDRRAAWLAAPAGAQETLVTAAADRFFRPPYVGHRGWLGVYLDVPVDWDELEALVRDAWDVVATPAIRRRAGRPTE
jgi:predicted DNA-binding protein (MmcQ/YjbR family)